MRQRVQQLPHGEFLMVEHIVLHGSQTVGNCTDANALNVIGIIAGSAGVVILALDDTVVGDDGQEGYRCWSVSEPVHLHAGELLIIGSFD